MEIYKLLENARGDTSRSKTIQKAGISMAAMRNFKQDAGNIETYKALFAALNIGLVKIDTLREARNTFRDKREDSQDDIKRAYYAGLNDAYSHIIKLVENANTTDTADTTDSANSSSDSSTNAARTSNTRSSSSATVKLPANYIKSNATAIGAKHNSSNSD